MLPFDIADPLPTGTTLLEASAGTGKTWTIGALVARYVAEGVADLDDLLVVTFGRAATQELRERVREHLRLAEAALADPVAHPDDALVAVLAGADAQEVALRRQRLRDALARFDAATIATTHQFCHLVLRSLGVAGDTDAEAALVENLDDRLVEVVDDLYLRGFARAQGEPEFTREEALKIARLVAIDDPGAWLTPADAAKGSPAARRVAFAHAVRDELDRRKRDLGLLSYDDLLSRLADALDGPLGSGARRRMNSRWRVVLVDEFQDTDPVQWQVLNRAFGQDATLVLIGDPKQAIYAFRGGDVVTYLAAGRTAVDRRTLDTNWRSDEPLVKSLQAVLNSAELGDAEIVVRGVQAHHQDSRLAGLPKPAPWRMRVMSRGLLGESPDRTATVGQGRPVIADDVAADIAATLDSGATFDGRPLRAGDIAVLAPISASLDLVRQALAERGIRAVVADSGSVLTSAAAKHWLAVLEAMAAPHRRNLVRAAALTPLVGVSATELDADAEVQDERLSALMRRWSELLALRGVAAVLESATALGLPERLLAVRGGERDLTDLRHVAELLHDLGRRDGLKLMGLLSWLRVQIADERPVAGTRSRRLDSDAHAVQLSTIHASKGLQYPIVYLPFLGDRFVPKQNLTPRYHGGADGEQRCIDVGGSPAKTVSAQAQAEDDGENLRLAYVALTRAQSQVVTWWAPMTTADRSSLQRLMLGRGPGEAQVPTSVSVPPDAQVRERFTRWQQAGGPVWEEVAPAARRAAPEEVEQAHPRVRTFTRAVDTQWRRSSYTALTSVAAEHTSEPTSEPETEPKSDEPELAMPVLNPSAGTATAAQVPSPMADLPVGATFGSLVHAVLEEADPQAEDLKAELSQHIREQSVLWPVPDLDAGLLADALVAVCLTPMGPLAQEARLVDIGRSDRLCELDFEMPLSGGDLAAGTTDVRLGDVGPLLDKHLPEGDPVRQYATALASPELGDQALRGYLTGSIDVVLRIGGRYLVVDYKTNWLGPADEPLTAAAYARGELEAAMGHSSYPLQALLYAVVAHRFLRWRLPDYDPQTHLGGVLYLYLRGMCGPENPVVDGWPTGVFSWQPPVALVTELSDLFDGRTS
ncbi:UvrD-helicase domain-containing protein [Dermacoccaceae bacterium W4C1]